MTDEPPSLHNPLRAPLAPEQVALLSVIFDGASGTRPYHLPVWPRWAYVRTQLRRVDGLGRPDALQVLNSFETVRVHNSYGASRYGPIWRDNNHGATLLDDERVGLTISGLVHLAGNRELDPAVPEAITDLVRTAARQADAHPVDPEAESPRYAAPLHHFASTLRPLPLFLPLLGKSLAHEYTPFAQMGGDAVYGWTFDFSPDGLELAIGQNSAADYLDKVHQHSQERISASVDPLRHGVLRLPTWSLNAVSDPTAIVELLDRIRGALPQDPAQAIGAAKELIESTAKLVLIERKQEVPAGREISALVSRAADALDLRTKNPSTHPDGSPSLNRILSAAIAMAIGVGELRNAGYGTGHGGTDGRPGLSERHAYLVVDAAAAWCQLMLATLGDPAASWHQQTPSPEGSPPDAVTAADESR